MNSLRVAILATGDELLNGSGCDTNTRDIARLLGPAGYHINTALCVPDNPEAIHRALHQLISQQDVIICTGGLGSTGDDLTAKTVAQALGRPLEENPKAADMIRKRYADRGRELDPGVLRQAILPQKSIPLPNSQGTAPGFWLRQQNCDLFFLPGVPAEMRAMMINSVIPALQRTKPGGAPLLRRSFGFFGLSEPQIEARIPYDELPAEVQVAFSLDFPLVKLTLKAASPAAGDLLDEAEALLVGTLGDYLVSRGDESMAEHVGALLRHAGIKLALAESCTGGLISHMLTSVAGASDFLERGAVTYADSAKIDWLNVSPAIISTHGAVSEECALAMATGLRTATQNDLTLAVTGIAGPGGGTQEKPVGTVFLALAAEGVSQVRGYQFSGDRQQIQRMSAFMALEWLRRFALESLNSAKTQLGPGDRLP
ncbi:CinA family nicotinamide mononucleotide deamidase-related protein [Geopsychrobacter electrodiphilus]|uniref:CinA family nicotinamide mononucleotide deamidase-related protein n=1 Tax=Geopsychrobacter electrodiphilus TaxID=225196 RepID=UPI000382BC44|nr:CinA family nicotinamide mononucleotide deamidase-related protein [Geopsychrobacter electrodiphilus]